MPFKDKNVKYLSYFDEIEVHNNNEILKTRDNINCLVYGYVKQNTEDIYDLSAVTKIIVKYFGAPANQSIFTVLRKNRGNSNYKDAFAGNMSGDNFNYENNSNVHHLEMGHLYRSIIFNAPLNKNSVKLTIIRANICDYWKKHCSQAKLGFGFVVGLIQLHLNEKIAFNCSDDNINVNRNSLNPLSLSHDMDSFVTDLVGLYYNSLRKLRAAHFVFDTNKNCFVYKTLFNCDTEARGLSNIHEAIDVDEQTSRSYDNKQMRHMGLGQSIEIHMHVKHILGLTGLRYCSLFLTFDGNRINLVTNDIGHDDCNIVWLPVVSCVGCNCPSCSDSPLVLSLTTSKKPK